VGIADGLRLPYKDAIADVVISIAVVHHWASEERRVAAIKELMRILRPGGEMLVYVWALEQQEGSSYGRKFETQDVMVPWKLQPKPAAELTPEERVAKEEEKRAKGRAKAAAKKAKKMAAKKSKADGVLAGDFSPESTPATEKESEAAPELPAVDVLQRYYHVFAEGELEALVGKVPGLEVKDRFFDHANWCVVARKIVPPLPGGGPCV